MPEDFEVTEETQPEPKTEPTPDVAPEPTPEPTPTPDPPVAEPTPDVAPETAPESRAEEFAKAIDASIAKGKEALAHLETSSNAIHPGTIVFDTIQKLKAHIASMETAVAKFRD